MKISLFLCFIATVSSFPAPDSPSHSREGRSADDLGDLDRWDPVQASNSYNFKAWWSVSSKNPKPSIKISTSFSNKTHQFSQVLDDIGSRNLLESLSGPIENQISQVIGSISDDMEQMIAGVSATGFDASTPKFIKKIAALGEEYLGKFGYMSKTKANSAKLGGLIDPASFKQSIKEFQRMAGINPSGELNKETMKMMSKSRCGVEDTMGAFTMGVEGNEADSKFRSKKQRRMRNKRRKERKNRKNKNKRGRSRSKRYNLEGGRWSKTDLKYVIRNYTPDMPEAQTQDAIQRAFDLWAEQTPLTFTRIDDVNQADLKIEFGARKHGDNYPFDGKGGTLAHAFFPSDGRAHFDEDEHFTYKKNEGINLFIVAAHEFGHSLGLAHSSVPNSLMAPFYQGYVSNYQLHADDIAAIQQLYGIKVDERKKKPKPTEPSKRPNKPNKPTKKPRPDAMRICGKNTSFDASFFDRRKSCTYVFKGIYYWKLNDYGEVPGYPKKINRYWKGLPGNLNAAAYVNYNGDTFFFKGSRVWKYNRDRVLVRGFPKSTDYYNIPASPNAATQWGRDGMIYLFKGRYYYRFSEDNRSLNTIGKDKHVKISKYWKGIPDIPDGALQWKNGENYFFKDNHYYKFSNFKLEVDNGYPKSIRRFWVGCTGRDTTSKLTKKGKKSRGRGKGKKKVKNTRAKLAKLELAPTAPR